MDGAGGHPRPPGPPTGGALSGASLRAAARERAFLLRHLLGIRGLHRRLRARRIPRRPVPSEGTPLRAVFLPVAPATDPGMFARMFQWQPWLADRGVSVRMLPPCTGEAYSGLWTRGPEENYRFHDDTIRTLAGNLDEAAGADVVVLHRSLLPFSVWQRPSLERLLARANPRVVYDMFDSIWVNRRRAHDTARGPLGRWFNPPDAVERIAATAAAVTVSSEHLAEFARAHNPSVHVVPMLVDLDRFPLKEHRDGAEVVLGWTGNAGNLSRVESIVPALRRVARTRRVRLRVVSWRNFEAEGVPTESLTHPWTPENEIEDCLAADIGLLPMFDDAVDRGKFPFKLLQYSAAGLPTVASPVAVDRDAFRHGDSILFAGNEGEWADAIERLASDPGLRSSMGRAAREVVSRRFTYAVHADRFAGLLRAVAAGRAIPPPS